MGKHWNKWISPLSSGNLNMPEKVRRTLGWKNDDVVLMEMLDDDGVKELRVRKCKEVDVLDVEMWFDDREGMEKALGSPEARAMFDDGTLFIETVTSFVVDEQVVIGD